MVASAAAVLRTAAPVGSSSFPGDNGKIAFSLLGVDFLDIYVMNPDGSGQTNLTNNPTGRNSGPDWSPDGEKIAFSTHRDGNFEIYVMNADGSGLTNLTHSPADEGEPSWSPDGEKIVYVRHQIPGNFQIWVMNADGTGQKDLTDHSPSTVINDDLPSWSPDGEKIAFTTDRDGDHEIYVMNPDGSDQTNLTNNAGASDAGSSWSPDGEKIAFTSDRDVFGVPEVYSMDADGTHQTRLTQSAPGGSSTPSWSPDGEKIAFTSDRDDVGKFELYVMDADGSDQSRRTSVDPLNVLDLSWQPLEVEGDVTVTKWVNGTPPPGAVFEVRVVCDNGDDEFTTTLTFAETGGTQSFERESFGPLECTVTETGTGGATTVEIVCDAHENAECDQPDTFTLFDDPGDDGSKVDINVTNWFPVTAEPTFTG